MAQGPETMEGPGFGHRPPIERAFGGHGIEGRWWNNPKIVERLKLTDDQRKAFDQILLDHREKLIDLRANVEKTELAMEPLVQMSRTSRRFWRRSTKWLRHARSSRRRMRVTCWPFAVS